MKQLRIKVSSIIANEWCGRGITDVIPDLPDYPMGGGMLPVSLAVAREIPADCDFNGDAKNGPELMPGGTRCAYRAMAEQLREALASH